MKTTTDRWDSEYKMIKKDVKKDIKKDIKHLEEENQGRDRDYYGYFCDKDLCVESGV